MLDKRKLHKISFASFDFFDQHKYHLIIIVNVILIESTISFNAKDAFNSI